MKRSNKNYTLFLNDFPMFTSYSIVGTDNLFSSDRSQQNDQFWSLNQKLLSQVVDAGTFFRWRWVPVLRWATLDNIGNIHLTSV